MQFLSGWSYPTYCVACNVLQERIAESGAQPFLPTGNDECHRHNYEYSNNHSSSLLTTTSTSAPKTTRKIESKIHCYKCNMKETLWVCLSCGIIGCGHYSNGHAEKHYKETFHPFSLELATQRIWDYDCSSFVNRDDFLHCMYMQEILGAVNRAAYQQGVASALSSCTTSNSATANANSNATGSGAVSKKKTAFLGEEYEALLQSALEDQAQHFDLEIAHLQAQLASEAIDKSRITVEQMSEIEILEKGITKVRKEVDVLRKDYVKIQEEEASHRVKSNLLLREQGEKKAILDKLREEVTREHQEGKQVIEDLEQQVSIFVYV